MIRWTRVCTLVVSMAVLAHAEPLVRAQQAQGAAPESPAAAPVQSAEAIFSDASAKEAAVRKALADPARQPTVLKAVRTVVADYERVVRHHPTSSYCDDALWRAGRLSRDAFDLFHDAHERAAALRLLQQLSSQYPTSRLARLAPEQIAWLNDHATGAPRTTAVASPAEPKSSAAAEGAPAPADVPASRRTTAAATTADTSEQRRTTTASASPEVPKRRSAPASAPTAPVEATLRRPRTAPAQPSQTASALASARVVTVKAVRRAVLSNVVRVVIEMDGEVPFHEERIEGPSRVFVDLPSTRTAAGLADQTLRFDGDVEIVRQIRVGRQPNGTTRVVLDATGVSSYSVYPLYAPFRLVIDCLRTMPAVAQRPAAVSRMPAPVSKPPVPAIRPKPDSVAAAATLHSAPLTTALKLPEAAMPRIEPLVAPSAVLRSQSARWSMVLPSGAAVVVSAATSGDAPASASSLPAWARPETVRSPSIPSPPPVAAVVPKPDPRGLSMARQLGLGVSRIVIDPGHGGHDPGAQADGINEADLVLDVALRLEKLLKKLPGVEVVLTRRDNEFVTLQERTAIANRENADLFLSIHANANSAASARGVETYFLNFATSQTAAAVAARENATSDQTMGALQDVVKAIALNSKVDESRDLATYVQHEMIESLRPADRTVKDLGVKQAPFVVLVGASMPSVLAEVSFITNPQDARLLKTQPYRQRISQALYEAVRKYQQSLKQASSIAQQQ